MKRFIALVLAVLSGFSVFFVACDKNQTPEHIHAYTWFVVRQASCTQEGQLEGLCSCGEKTYETVPKSHMMNSDGICVLCGEVDNATHTHEWVWADVVKPTCDENGLSTATCKKCSATNMKTIQATGHAYGWDGICAVCGKGAANLNERWEYDYLDVEKIWGKSFRPLNSELTNIAVENISINSAGALKMDIKYGGAVRIDVDEAFGIEPEKPKAIKNICWTGAMIDYEITVPTNVKTISQFVLREDGEGTKFATQNYKDITSIIYTDGTKTGIGIVAGVHILGWTDYDGKETEESRNYYNQYIEEFAIEEYGAENILENILINQDNLLLGVYADSKVRVLGKIATTNENFTKSKYAFIENDDGNMCFANILDKTITEVVIPSSHAGKPVEDIIQIYNDTVTKLIVPSSVKNVVKSAFVNCPNLKGIIFEGDIKQLRPLAFDGCSKLEYVVLNEVDVMGYFVFENTNIFLNKYTKVPEDWALWQTNCKVYCKGEWTYVDGIPTPYK